jgi:hypothetical protein
MSPHLGAPSSSSGRGSPQPPRLGGGGGGGRVSPLAGGRTSPLKQMMSAQGPFPPPPNSQQRLQPQRYKRLSGVGVSRLSTGSDGESDGERNSWGRSPKGGQGGWSKQPGLGVGFLPG